MKINTIGISQYSTKIEEKVNMNKAENENWIYKWKSKSIDLTKESLKIYFIIIE